MIFEDDFLRSTVIVEKLSTSKKERFNNFFVTKQIYFSSAFLKSWVNISDNIAGVIGGPQYN